MLKIFKYKYDRETNSAIMPDYKLVLRIEHVDDGFYKGDFIWAIVDPTDTFLSEKKFNLGFPYNAAPKQSAENLVPVRIKVKEAQKIKCGEPVFAQEKDGDIYIYTEPHTKIKEHEIVVYKTGQEIREDLNKLKYIGLNKIWIIMELGLYTFLKNDSL